MKYFRDYIVPNINNGVIIKCDKQVKYELLPSFIHNGQKYEAIHYVSDFNIYYSDGSLKVIDIKGLAKPLDIIKRKLLLYRYPELDFEWVVFSKMDFPSGWGNYETLKKARAKRKKEKLKERTT